MPNIYRSNVQCYPRVYRSDYGLLIPNKCSDSIRTVSAARSYIIIGRFSISKDVPAMSEYIKYSHFEFTSCCWFYHLHIFQSSFNLSFKSAVSSIYSFILWFYSIKNMIFNVSTSFCCSFFNVHSGKFSTNLYIFPSSFC